MPEEEPKSAYEIAMEKLRKKDREEGGDPAVSLTEEQKRKIAEVRRHFEAKLAEMEILHRSRLREAKRQDPEEADKIEESFRRDRQRLEEEREGRLERIRRG